MGDQWGKWSSSQSQDPPSLPQSAAPGVYSGGIQPKGDISIHSGICWDVLFLSAFFSLIHTGPCCHLGGVIIPSIFLTFMCLYLLIDISFDLISCEVKDSGLFPLCWREDAEFLLPLGVIIYHREPLIPSDHSLDLPRSKAFTPFLHKAYTYMMPSQNHPGLILHSDE